MSLPLVLSLGVITLCSRMQVLIYFVRVCRLVSHTTSAFFTVLTTISTCLCSVWTWSWTRLVFCAARTCLLPSKPSNPPFLKHPFHPNLHPTARPLPSSPFPVRLPFLTLWSTRFCNLIVLQSILTIYWECVLCRAMVDPHIADEMQKNGGDYRYLSRAYEWRSFFSESRNWITHDETFAPFDDKFVIDERSRAIQLAQTLLYIRDHLGPVTSWKKAAGEYGADYDVEACKACDETVETLTTASYHLLDFESDEGSGLLHLAASAGCCEIFSNLLRIGAVVDPTVHPKSPPADYFSVSAGTDAAFDTRAHRKYERLVRILYNFADAAFVDSERLREEAAMASGSTAKNKESESPTNNNGVPRIFSRTGEVKGFETALKILKGHLSALQMFTPHGSFENAEPSPAARDVLNVSADGQARGTTTSTTFGAPVPCGRPSVLISLRGAPC
jgi:hypothetical protein